MLFTHPLSFELCLTTNACGSKSSQSKKWFYSSDGQEVCRIIRSEESQIMLKESFEQLLKTANCILEKKQILNSTTRHFATRIIATFNHPGEKGTTVGIIVVDDTNLTILYAPTLWHAQEFEYFLSQN